MKINISNWFRKLGSAFISYTESLGRARAAAELSRLGFHKAAQDLIIKERF